MSPQGALHDGDGVDLDETLHEPADLGEWLVLPPLAAVMTTPVTARELAAAKVLRLAIWDTAHARAAQALSTLAREMIELLSGPLSGRIRECASDDCPLVFVDSSRPGARRWCAMERCGNRRKLRALRARRATGGQASYSI